jgi:hypothetical protein
MVDFSLNLDGNVFGFVDPDPLSMSGSVQGDGSLLFTPVNHAVYGNVTGGIASNGALNLMMTPPAFTGIASVLVTGNIPLLSLPNSIDLNYSIGFAFPSAPAQGVINLTAVPEPVTLTSLLLAGLGVTSLSNRRRSRPPFVR